MTDLFAPLSAVNDFLDLPPKAGVHPSATPVQQALLDWAAANEIVRPAIPMDGNNRYRTVAPVGDGKERGHTRVTKFCEALDGDTTGLDIWRHRILATGLTATDERVRAVRAAVAAGDMKAVTIEVDKALFEAGEKLKADLGTAFHTAMEHAVTGTGLRPPAPYDADVEATLAAMAKAGLEPTPFLETRLFVPGHNLIGTGDLLVQGGWGPKLRVGDYKTGASYEHIGYALQQSLYDRASHMWTAEGWQEVPALDHGTAYLIHTPLTTGVCTIVEVHLAEAWKLAELAAAMREAQTAATARSLFTPLLSVDINLAGKLEETAAQTSSAPALVQEGAVHPVPSVNADGAPTSVGQEEAGTTCPVSSEIGRADEAAPSTGATAVPIAAVATAPAGDGAIPPAPSPASPPSPASSPHEGGPAPMDDTAARTAWINTRMAAIKGTGNELAMRAAAQYWPPSTPYPPGPYTDEQVEAIHAVLIEIERLDGMPFAPHAPGAKEAQMAALPEVVEEAAAPPTDPPPTPDALTALKDLAASPDVAARGIVIRQWAQQGVDAGAKWDEGPKTMTARHCEIQLAVVACALHLLDGNDPDDSLVRCAVAEAIGDDDLTVPTGAALGALTTDEATRLATLAGAYGSGDDEAVAVLAARLNRQFAQAS